MVLREGEQLMEQLHFDLEDISKSGRSKIAQLTDSVDLISNRQAMLKQIVLKADFSSNDEEVAFFKTLKPKLVSEFIFYNRCLFIEMNKPGVSKKDIRKYIQKEQRSIKSFFDFNHNFVQYFRSGSTAMDHLLFLRGVSEVPKWLVMLRFDQDERFSTAADHIVARILSYEKLSPFLSNELSISESGDPIIRTTRSIPWTGDSINLVEMAYGIYYSKQLNHGKAGIGEIISILEEVFKVKIENPSRRFAEIKRRKRMSTTKFLDEMRDSIIRRIEDDEDLLTSPSGYK